MEVLLLPNSSASTTADEKIIELPVVVVVVENTLSLFLVTTRSTAFLNVAL
jgi:hypothetical protein